MSGGGSEPEPNRGPSDDGGAAPSSSGSDPEADTPLGDCTLGRPELQGFDQPCAWVAEDRCHDTREMACNCACPRERDSQCVSGFEAGPHGRVWVSCG